MESTDLLSEFNCKFFLEKTENLKLQFEKLLQVIKTDILTHQCVRIHNIGDFMQSCLYFL